MLLSLTTSFKFINIAMRQYLILWPSHFVTCTSRPENTKNLPWIGYPQSFPNSTSFQFSYSNLAAAYHSTLITHLTEHSCPINILSILLDLFVMAAMNNRIRGSLVYLCLCSVASQNDLWLDEEMGNDYGIRIYWGIGWTITDWHCSNFWRYVVSYGANESERWRKLKYDIPRT